MQKKYKMKTSTLQLKLSLFITLLTIGVYAQGPPGGGRGQGRGQQRNSKPDASEILSLLDTNKDEVIDRDEASKDKRGKISEDFDDIDANGDDVIDLDELKASLNNKKPKQISAENIIKTVDDNNDGTLNELEVAAKNKRDLIENFKDIDTNQDNELDLDELKVFYATKEKPKRRKRD